MNQETFYLITAICSVMLTAVILTKAMPRGLLRPSNYRRNERRFERQNEEICQLFESVQALEQKIANIHDTLKILTRPLQSETPMDKMKNNIREAFKNMPEPQLQQYPYKYLKVSHSHTGSIQLSFVNEGKETIVVTKQFDNGNSFIVVQGFPVLEPENIIVYPE